MGGILRNRILLTAPIADATAQVLKTFLGHSYPQVLAGLLLGIAAAWIFLG